MTDGSGEAVYQYNPRAARAFDLAPGEAFALPADLAPGVEPGVWGCPGGTVRGVPSPPPWDERPVAARSGA